MQIEAKPQVHMPRTLLRSGAANYVFAQTRMDTSWMRGKIAARTVAETGAPR
jgi:hypothetical protein